MCLWEEIFRGKKTLFAALFCTLWVSEAVEPPTPLNLLKIIYQREVVSLV